MAVSLVIPASRACVSAAGPTTLGCKESHVAASLSPAGLEWELMSSSLAIPPSGHCPSLPSVSCPPTCEGVPFSRDAPSPPAHSPLSLSCSSACGARLWCAQGFASLARWHPVEDSHSAPRTVPSAIERVSHPL